MCQKILEKTNLSNIFKKTGILNLSNSKSIQPGIIICEGDDGFELMVDNILIGSSQDKSEILSMFVCFHRVFSLSTANYSKNLMQLIKY